MGLRGDMCIETVSGPTKISELSNRTVLNPDYTETAFVWSSGTFFLGEVGGVKSIGLQQLFEVVLDDGAKLQVSPSSRFVMRSGERKMPPELVPGDSLLPLYLEEDVYGYPTYRIPGRYVKRKIARLIAEWKLGHPLGPGTTVEHIDKNRKHYHPDNLNIIINPNRAKKRHRNKIIKALDLAKDILDECAAASPKMAKIVGKRGRRNHKVTRVTPGSLEEVFTASVRSMGSLAVSGVFLELPSC